MIKNEIELLDVFLDEIHKEWIAIHEFWANNTVDEVKGGFIGELSSSGEINTKADKGAVLNTRLLWSFSSAYNHSMNPEYLELAKRAFDYLLTHFYDHDYGGLCWVVNTEGAVVDDRKQAYAQGFGIYAFAEYYKASGDEMSKQYAINLYKIVEEKFRDEKNGGYVEALGRNWTPLSDMRLSEKDAKEPKSMNTHLHIIEPYTNLYSVWQDADLKQCIQELLELFKEKILNKDTAQFQLFFDMDWNVKSTEISFGHDIEASWLLCDAARAIKDKLLIDEMEKLAIRVVDKVLDDGTDMDGSVFYEQHGELIDTDKHWWVQAESIIGLVDAYKVSGNELYLDKAIRIWDFVKANIKDTKNGGWYWRVDKNKKTVLSDCKVGFWKCPYHNTRALIESFSRLNTNRQTIIIDE